jgi:ubiquinone/menaquinone biosynthesis C-methylase UbiE
MNCDRIAPVYELFEKAAFGGKLQRHRVTYLEAAKGGRFVLVLGDGDGRFTEALATAYPELEIDSIEMSAGMVSEARGRLGSKSGVRVIRDDALRVCLRQAHYDTVFTHFFLDCFEADDVSELVRRVSEAIRPGAVWVVSDFREAESGWRKLYTRAWLEIMYRFFRCATGLKTRRLPEYGAAFARAGFVKRGEQVSMGGLIASELWQRQCSTG